jgi:hypothetical protein
MVTKRYRWLPRGYRWFYPWLNAYQGISRVVTINGYRRVLMVTKGYQMVTKGYQWLPRGIDGYQGVLIVTKG